MARLLLTQDVFLLAHDDETGKNTASIALDGALSAALLLDLAERELIDVVDDDVVATGATIEDPLLVDALAAITGDDKTRDVGHWLYQLPRKVKPLGKRVGASLVEQGILAEEQGKTLGIFPTTRWPERDPAPEQELRAELHDTLLGDREPSARVLMLVAVLHQSQLIDKAFEKSDRKQARARAEALAKQAESSDAVSHAVGESIRATQAAVMATIIASTAASTVFIATSN